MLTFFFFGSLNNIQSLKQIGCDLLLGRMFNEIGFNKIEGKYFRELVLARVALPKSKLKTTEYLYRYKQINWDEDQLYRCLDKHEELLLVRHKYFSTQRFCFLAGYVIIINAGWPCFGVYFFCVFIHLNFLHEFSLCVCNTNG